VAEAIRTTARRDETPMKNRHRLEEFTALALAMDQHCDLRGAVKAETYLDKLRSPAIFTCP